jgi:hypothetical protein
MKILIILGILLVACAWSRKEGLLGWREEPNIDYPGNDIAGGHGTKSKVHGLCEANPACLGYNHNPATGAYWMKHKLENRGPLPDYTFYTKQVPFVGFKNVFSGNKCLDIVNDGANNKTIMGTCGKYSGQQWTMTPADPGHVKFSNRFTGAKKCLEARGTSLLMNDCNADPSQRWKVEADKYNKNYNRVSNGQTKMCVDIINDGQNNKLTLGPCGHYSGQQWYSVN